MAKALEKLASELKRHLWMVLGIMQKLKALMEQVVRSLKIKLSS
jgi:hypothetical protein